MDNEIILWSILILLLVINILMTFSKNKKNRENIEEKEIKNAILKFGHRLEFLDKSIKEEFQRSRQDLNKEARNNREELTLSLKTFKEEFEGNTKFLNKLIKEKFVDFSKQQVIINAQFEQRINAIKETVDRKLLQIGEDNNKQLNKLRKTVNEKLQKTLNDRLSQSFNIVGKQLKAVQEGLGEMKILAKDVGGLKRVLSNVKMRGGIGEIQLAMLLEQILAPNQYESNVETKKGSNAIVEFAIKLPGHDIESDAVWLPIDAKFPKDIYEKLQDAYEYGEHDQILIAQKELVQTIKKMAKDISSKYIDPPNTTDFAIMFLPFEGIYAEVVRKASLLEELQRDYKIIVTGPTTLAAILNSLQMGFRTLAIQKRSGEVWQVLSGVKKEFENFGGLMQKAQKNIRTGLNQLDDVMGKRTRAIQRELKHVEVIDKIDINSIEDQIKGE